MRSTLLVTLLICLLAGISHGFTDFHALNPHHSREEMPDGTVHLRHDVHHTFPEHGTFFRAKYHAVHHKKWHFVDVSKHADFDQHVDCGASAHELLVRQPSKELLADLAKQNYEHTVLTAHHMFHCGKNAIFRTVTGVHHDEKHNIAKLSTQQMQYEDLFEHLDFVLETNHLEHEGTDESATDMLHLPSVAADVVNPDAAAAEAEANAHGMQEQGKWWKKVKKAAKRVVSKVKKTVTKAVTRVKEAVRSVASFLGGNYAKTLTKSWSVLNYNKDVTKSFTTWGFNGDAKLAVSATAGVTLYFNLQIASFKVNVFETYVYGSFQAGARASFNSRIFQDVAASKEFAKLNVAPITFSIVGVSIVITPSMVINGGYDLDIDGRLNINMVVGAQGYIKQGYKYTPSLGFTTINQKYFAYTYDFSPREYRYEVGLNVYVQANFGLSVNVLGSATAAIQINGEALLQRNSHCSTSMQVNVHPIVTLGANLNIRLAGRTLVDRTWGPQAYLSTKKSLVSFCTPYRYPSARSRGMLTMEVSGDSDKNSNAITTQQVGSMSMNYTGTTWEAEQVYCPTSAGVASYMQVSAQFMPGDVEDETQLIINVARNTSTNDGSYVQTNLQQTYSFIGEITPSMSSQTLTRKTNATEEGSFDADSNVNSTAYVAPYIYLTVGASNSEAITLRESTMLCGSAVLQAATLSDDNTTFTLFASGQSEPETFFTKLKAYAIYAPILAVVVVALILVIVMVTRKKKQEAHGANWAKAVSTDDEPVTDARVAAL